MREKPLWMRISGSFMGSQFGTMSNPDVNVLPQSGKCGRGQTEIPKATHKSRREIRI